MKIVFISDTHGEHSHLDLPEGEMIIHAGDVSSRGTEDEVRNFLQWYSSLNFKYKILIAGNHDFFFEHETDETIQSVIPDNIIYLNDSGIRIEGIHIWGSPVQPRFFDWAFNRDRGEDINRHWQLLPDNVDILITHGPPSGILDQTVRGESVGCEMLLEKIKQLERLKIHVFGHIHEAYGIEERMGIRFINASILDVRYRLSHQPIVVEWGTIFDK